MNLLLRCRDIAETRAFYRDVLGFEVRDAANGTVSAIKGADTLIFSILDALGATPSLSGTLYFFVRDLDAYYALLKDRVSFAWPLQDMPYGTREFAVRDCNGYTLAFAQDRTGPAAPVPILRSFDEAKAREFYIDFLGFQVDWQHRFEPGLPLYMQVSKGACVLHLSEHHGDATPGAALRIETSGLDALRDALLAKQYKNARPGIVDQPWGRDMAIADPFGNRLIFTTLLRP
jgi:catechol 2,3-dioxygenase-like lactoylglutathione lyase family enzyme